MVNFFIFIFGGIAGALCDQIHVQANVLYYAHPLLFGQAWWVIPQYILATGISYNSAKLFNENTEKISYDTKAVVIASLWFLGTYFASAFLQRYSIFLTLVFLGIWCLRILLMRCTFRIAIYSCLFAFVGTCYEILLTHIGLFTYTHPNILGVPFWLPGLYLNAGLLVITLTGFIETKRADSKLITG